MAAAAARERARRARLRIRSARARVFQLSHLHVRVASAVVVAGDWVRRARAPDFVQPVERAVEGAAPRVLLAAQLDEVAAQPVQQPLVQHAVLEVLYRLAHRHAQRGCGSSEPVEAHLFKYVFSHVY